MKASAIGVAAAVLALTSATGPKQKAKLNGYRGTLLGAFSYELSFRISFQSPGILMRFASFALLVACGFASSEAAEFASHPPMRALPKASNRPLGTGPAKFVDAAKGDDATDGSEAKPWRTLTHAVLRLAPGDTLYLRGGSYYETVTLANKARADAPITLRAYPGELAIVDAGFRDFVDDPATAWEPAPGGHADEFRSTKTYELGGNFGNFADSMVPLHRYIDFYDLRSGNEFYRQSSNNRQTDPVGIYTGPGVHRDPETGRIHVRLSHTQLKGLGDDAYRGATDPRRVPLVVAGHDYALVVAGAQHVRFEDLVFRGASRSAVRVTRYGEDDAQPAEDVAFDGCTLYGGGSALRTDHVRGFRMTNCALRGHSAPWHSRFTSKNRAYAGYLGMIAGTNFEFADCEWTDHHDGLQFQGADELLVHHCLFDNFNDDGLEPGPKKSRGRAFIYQNLITRTLGPFTAHGEPTVVDAEPGSGVYVYRNVVDLRRGTYKAPPEQDDPTGAFLNHPNNGALTDHGSPTQQPYYVYHNTFLMPTGSFRGYYGFSWGSHARGTTRRVFNNIFLQMEGPPGANFAGLSPDDDFIGDGNLLWSATAKADEATGFFAKFRASLLFAASKRRYPAGWCAHDVFADPRFVRLESTTDRVADFRLQTDSPAVNAGVPVPQDWPDPLRAADAEAPDIGALPLGAEPFRVGLRK